MAKKQYESPTNIKLGTRVRHIEDGALGRIVWANAAAIKVQWDDGEKVTWKRAELGIKGLAVVEEDEAPETRAEQAGEPASQVPAEPVQASEVVPPAEPISAAAVVDQAVTEPQAETTTEPADASEAPAGTPAQPAANASEATPEQPAEQPKKRRARTPAPEGTKKTSAIDAAAKVLAEEGKPMGCKELIGAMAAKGYWTSPGGKTPAATLYSALLREIETKGDASRFQKVGRGMFALRPQA
jgi:hypothetical protein